MAPALLLAVLNTWIIIEFKRISQRRKILAKGIQCSEVSGYVSPSVNDPSFAPASGYNDESKLEIGYNNRCNADCVESIRLVERNYLQGNAQSDNFNPEIHTKQNKSDEFSSVVGATSYYKTSTPMDESIPNHFAETVFIVSECDATTVNAPPTPSKSVRNSPIQFNHNANNTNDIQSETQSSKVILQQEQQRLADSMTNINNGYVHFSADTVNIPLTPICHNSPQREMVNSNQQNLFEGRSTEAALVITTPLVGTDLMTMQVKREYSYE